MGYPEFRHRFLMFPELLSKIKLAKSSNAMLCGRWCQKEFLHWLKSDRVRSRHVSLLPLSHLPWDPDPSKLTDMYSRHMKRTCISPCPPLVEVKRFMVKYAVSPTVYLKAEKRGKLQTCWIKSRNMLTWQCTCALHRIVRLDQMNCAAYTPCHHASPYILVCNVSVFVCVCVQVGSSCNSSSGVVQCPWFLWVSLGVSGSLTAWTFRTRAANTQWPRKQQTQWSPKSQSPEAIK